MLASERCHHRSGAVRRSAVAALAVLVAASGILLAGVPAPAHAQTSTGFLDWGVRTSFREYVVGPIAHGEITVGDDATVNGDGSFRFPAKAGSQVGEEAVEAAFTGSVAFSGHGGVLEVSIADLRISVEGDAGTVVADVTSRPFESTNEAEPAVTYDDVVLAELDLTGIDPVAAGEGLLAWNGVPATLTAAGVPAFAGFYEVGTELAPVSFTLPSDLDPGPVDPGPVDPDPDPVAPDPEPEVDGIAEVTGGFLDWGFKESFRNYIEGNIAKGSISLTGGATENADGTFHFPARAEGTYDAATGAVTASFQGAVEFRGHGYHDPSAGDLLQLTVSDLRLEATANAGVLIADVVSLPLEGDITNPSAGAEPVTYDDVALAALDLAGVTPVAAGADGAAWLDVPTALTEAGTPTFSNFYAAGTPLDPASYTLTLSEVGDLPEPPPEDVEEPGVVLDRTSVRVGERLTASGAGFLPGEQVEVWVHSTPVWVGTALADASGTATHTFTVPAEVLPGEHQVELRGISSGLSEWSPTFTVLPGTGGAAPVAGRGTLPATGTEGVLAVVGGAFLLAGAALVVTSRRRRPA